MIRRNFPTRPFPALACLLAVFSMAIVGCGETDTSVEASVKDLPGQGQAKQADAKPEPPAPNNPREAKGVKAKPGYQVELLHETSRGDEGSWVALCKGPNGTLYASSQYMDYKEGNENKKRRTLYQIKPAPIGDFEAKTQVIPQPIDINGAQGLCYAFGALYVMESGRQNGLMRVTDSDGDGLLDKKELILNIWGGGEHGTHAIVPTPDGKALYIIAGNMSPLPEPEHSKPVYKLWDEDQTLQREPDGRGHAAGLMAPGGWICRIDPDGKNLTLICNGFRNAYDMDVHPNGELFAYDADMEWDLGLPWYRPTRVNHVTSGAEFGWRNGSGKWPAYFEDSLPAVVDIGPGSPVGVTFGTGANFPTKYQSALYLLDWTYGTIYAVHLKPDGSSYTGELEPFVTGKPLPLTDVAIGDDGAMYFTVGGRRGDSALYRVTYYGNKDKTAPKVEPLNDLAKLRKKLEAMHKPTSDALEGIDLELIWDNLGHSDRHIRFAARVALEHLNPGLYTKRATQEKNAMTRTQAGLALARHRTPIAGEVLLGVDLKAADDTTKLAWLRAVGVWFARSGQPGAEAREQVLAKLSAMIPTENEHISTEVVRLRVFLNDPAAITYALELMNKPDAAEPPAWIELAAQNDRYGPAIRNLVDNPPPTDQLGLAFMLRNVKDGWTPATRQAYFSWLRTAAVAEGGNSYKPYLQRIFKQAVETLTETEKAALGPLAVFPTEKPEFPVVKPKGPGRNWTVAMATRLVDGKLKGQDYDRGVGLYQAVTCSQCHRVGTFGGEIGPDMASAAGFKTEDLMRAIIEPSHEISDQYKMSVVTKTNGEQVIGRIVEQDNRLVKVQPNPLDPKTINVFRDQIKSIEDSTTSTMPAGLINSMSADELKDLVAYIVSKGDREHEVFKK